MEKILSIIISLICSLNKVDKRKIVLESNPTLQDNTGALFQRMVELELLKNYDVTWLVYDDFDNFDLYPECKFLVVNKTSKVGKLIDRIRINIEISKAKFYIYSHRMHVMFPTKNQQRIVNLTHGIPIKDSSNKHSSQKYVTDIITLSTYSGMLRLKTYDGGYDKIRVLGYPRNDFLLNSKYQTNEKYFVWLPTYRTHKTILSANSFDYFPLRPSVEEFKKLNESLKKMNRTLYIKPHPAQKLDVKNNEYSNIVILDERFFIRENVHLYEFLGKSDGLITDYSSVYLDFLIVNKPIIFTFDDLDNYLEKWGFTVDNIFDVTPGDKVYTVDNLIIALEDIDHGFDRHKEHRSQVAHKFHKYFDDNSSDRVLEYLNLKNQ